MIWDKSKTRKKREKKNEKRGEFMTIKIPSQNSKHP